MGRSHPFTIRKIQPQDAAPFAALNAALAAESEFSLLTADEAKVSITRQEAIIRNIDDLDTVAVFVACSDEGLIGYAGATRGQYLRIRHCCVVSIGVRTAWRRRGVATKLMESLEMWAHTHGISRVELSVAISNEAALALYGKLGYAREGRKRQCFQHAGGLEDEFVMAKLL